MASSDHIIALFKPHLTQSPSVDLLVVYKGVPIHIQAVVLEAGNQKVKLKVEPPHLIALRSHRYGLILDSRFPQPLRARIVELNIAAGTVTLENFHYVSYTERTKVRVEPRNVVPVEIEIGNQLVVGALVDVSEIGVGIYVSGSDSENKINRLDTLQMTLRLPGGPVRVLGKINSIGRSVDYYRLAVHFIGLGENSEGIRRYTEDRQAEIVAELAALYDEAVRTRASASPGLYAQL